MDLFLVMFGINILLQLQRVSLKCLTVKKIYRDLAAANRLINVVSRVGVPVSLCSIPGDIANTKRLAERKYINKFVCPKEARLTQHELVLNSEEDTKFYQSSV